MSAPVFAVMGGPKRFYVHNLGTGDVVGGPYFERGFADLEAARFSAPYAAAGIVFMAESCESLSTYTVVQLGPCVSLLSAQQALDAYLEQSKGAQQMSVWIPTSVSSWRRDILWQDGDQLVSRWQAIRRTRVRKEDK